MKTLEGDNADKNSIGDHQRNRPWRRVRLMGIPIDALTVDELNREIQRIVHSASDERALILHVNAHGMNMGWDDPQFREILHAASLVFCDGAGVRLAARLRGVLIPERITYADWIWQLAELAEQEGWRLFFLGGRPKVAHEAATELKTRFPRLKIVGTHHGYFDRRKGSAENTAVLNRIASAKPHILLVGFGMPIQEYWLSENWARLGVPVGLSGGAVFDYVSGRLRRSPAWMRQAGLEWLGRLIIEPRRLWKRYLVGNPLFLFRAIVSRQSASSTKEHDNAVES